MANEVKTIRYKIKQYESIEKSVLNDALEKIKNISGILDAKFDDEDSSLVYIIPESVGDYEIFSSLMAVLDEANIDLVFDEEIKRNDNETEEELTAETDKDEEVEDKTVKAKKEKKEEKANPEKSGTTTTTTTQPESGKIDDKSVTELYDLSFEENKALPKLGNQRAKIREYQQIQAKKLLSSGQNIETTRNGEVIIATVAANDLFLPNDTTLRPTAAKVLRPYMEYLKEAYTNHLTTVRVSAVFDWIKDNAACSDYVIPYAMGADDPLPNTPNNSVDNREKNRRLEIYLVPGKAMIRKSSRGQLTR